MQEITEEISRTIEKGEFDISFGRIKIGRPNIIEADGSSSLIMPYEARLRNLTYSAPVFVELTVKHEDQIDSETVEIGRIPVMVKSQICNTNGLSKEELIKNYEDINDPGGYFIINGNERVMVMAEDLAENQPFVETNKNGDLTLRLFSLRGTYRIPDINFRK